MHNQSVSLHRLAVTPKWAYVDAMSVVSCLPSYTLVRTECDVRTLRLALFHRRLRPLWLQCLNVKAVLTTQQMFVFNGEWILKRIKR